MAGKKRNRAGRVNATGRTVGDPRHVRLHHWLLKGPAWRSLSLPARCLLIEVWCRHNGQNNGEISYSVREAAKVLGVGKNTANRAFRELVDKGYLKAHQLGSFRWKGGLATEWELTAEPYRERSASKEFMSWRPEKQNPVPQGGTSGPPERDREANSPPSKTPETPLAVPLRGTIAPSHGPPERDTSILPAGGGGNGITISPFTFSHEAMLRHARGLNMTTTDKLNWQPECENIH